MKMMVKTGGIILVSGLLLAGCGCQTFTISTES
ncbi:hypothetical protein Lpl7_2593 [Lacticaseibacillus paracasei subsp. tolerans Lpl7]|uniref:Uncharacterized protein n=1 Tax=Lacticaseibacillus paracasei TaxID=1597 RepID=A0A422L7W7_LACPA|nr:hypothetical protein Lpl7_2593 [Lacticaseibacillus paracasei subsp. tolerans Lpl7]RND34249.1 hypothetical protein FAM10859_03009 [Lacticaseibacillus paracasei]RND86994.1 hypothetical protein FAM18175_02812 [Lacticaseibacillus paracasei]RND88443.1 hypothetical protein FAM18172_00414 [Lacticaseibacillus paracasei]RNE34563.1 hypothetical protein FAM7821_02972 [Lacticaseibacillus paracasei]